MTTFALDYDHATALAKDLERAAIDVREPAAPPVDLSLPAHAAGHQEFLSAMQRASSVTAMQSRQLAQRLSAAADSGFAMVRDASLAENATRAGIHSLADAVPTAEDVR